MKRATRGGQDEEQAARKAAARPKKRRQKKVRRRKLLPQRPRQENFEAEEDCPARLLLEGHDSLG